MNRSYLPNFESVTSRTATFALVLQNQNRVLFVRNLSQDAAAAKNRGLENARSNLRYMPIAAHTDEQMIEKNHLLAAAREERRNRAAAALAATAAARTKVGAAGPNAKTRGYKIKR